MRPLAQALRSWRRSGWSDRAEVLRILALAAVVEIGLRTMSLPTLARLLRVRVDLHSPQRGNAMTVRPAEWAVRRIALTRSVLRYSRQTCLRNCLVLSCRLRSLQPVLRIGVRRQSGQLTAHAWLEIDDEYFDPEAQAYEPIHTASP